MTTLKIHEILQKHKETFGLEDLTPDHMTSVAVMVAGFLEGYAPKFAKGQKEHGGNIWKKNCVDEMIYEVLDQWSYASVVKAQWEEMKNTLEKYEKHLLLNQKSIPAAVQSVLKILRGEQ